MTRLPQLDIGDLPLSEDDHFEYKSSVIAFDKLKKELSSAASAFWNSGGGVFIVGVNDHGKPDGGVPTTIGRTPIRDWIDQVLKDVSPVGTYSIKVFEHDPTSQLAIASQKCVVAVEFEESPTPPHMASDQRYYIRAGAHTLPASHYVVEALWAKRRVQRPHLAHTLRVKPDATGVVQLAVLALTDVPAMSVKLWLDPLPEMWKDAGSTFPLNLPVLDRATPFYLDVTTYHAAAQRLGPDVQVRIEYEDFAGNPYDYSAKVDAKSLTPWRIGTPANEITAKSLESISKTIDRIPRSLDRLQSETAGLRSKIESLLRAVPLNRHREPSETAKRLSADARTLLLAARADGSVMFSEFSGGSRVYAGETMLLSPDQSEAREEARWLNAIFELYDLRLIDGEVQSGEGSSYFRMTHAGFNVADAISPAGGLDSGAS